MPPLRLPSPTTLLRRSLRTSALQHSHENPLGLPKRGPPSPMGRGPPQKRRIPYVGKVLAVASGKGGVGKSTVAVNLALSLLHNPPPSIPRPRVGILDLDIFGPSLPKLIGLESSNLSPELTSQGALRPLTNHSLPSMSIAYLLPGGKGAQDTPVVWRGMMVQKAVQQLLFDVDWRDDAGRELDLLVVDMPPGTGDVALTLGQLVETHGSVIVSTPQDVALLDTRKGIATFRKLSIPITGLLLNSSHFLCPSCSTPHLLFGPPTSFRSACAELGIENLGELPLVPGVSAGGDRGVPLVLRRGEGARGEEELRSALGGAARRVWEKVLARGEGERA